MSGRIIAVGGTGQMVLQTYIQLSIVGKFPDSFDAVIADTDKTIKSLEGFKVFFDALKWDHGKGTQGTIPSIAKIDLQQPEKQVGYLLTGVKEEARQKKHPADAFYSHDALLQTTKKGLYAMPALSSLVDLTGAVNSLDPEEYCALRKRADKPVVIGSVIGGTGGGFFAPLLERVRSMTTSGTTVQAVFVSNYFMPKRGSKITVDKLRSNERMVLSIIAQSNTPPDHYALIETPEEQWVERSHTAEKEGKQKTWHASSVEWRGALWTAELLSDAVSPVAPAFVDRCLTKAPTTPTINESYSQLATAISTANYLINNRVIERICAESLPEYVWGRRLPRFITEMWRHARSIDPDNESFPEEVQKSLRGLWTERVRPFLPAPLKKRHKLSPRKLAALPWPEPPNSELPRGFNQDTKKLTDWIAATLLWHALRGGA